jgi:hypothetical protein
LNNPNAYAISLIERDIIEEVRGWNLEYHCNICLDEGDELPTIENWNKVSHKTLYFNGNME